MFTWKVSSYSLADVQWTAWHTDTRPCSSLFSKIATLQFLEKSAQIGAVYYAHNQADAQGVNILTSTDFLSSESQSSHNWNFFNPEIFHIL